MNKIIASKNMSIIAVLGLVTATLSISASLTLPTSAADNSSEDNVAITIPVACTLVSSGNDSHSVAIVNGTYATDIGTTNLKVTCNDNQGFAIYAVGYTGNEIGATNSTKLVGTATSNNVTIDTGTATTAGNPDVSNWAMKLATNSGATYPVTIDNSFNAYHAVPASYTKVAHRDSGTDVGTNAVGSTLTTTYAAYISKTQAADTYSGQVKYTLVHPSAADAPPQPQIATSGCINYFANASDAVGTMGCQSISASATTATLLASNFSRANYGFAGWSDKYDYTTNPNAKFYGPQEDITFTAGQYTSPNNGLSLYAVWVPSAGTIQNWNSCSSLTQAPTNGTANLSSVTALTDQRDNETYAVARLADGKCWMIENLRLESTAAHNSDGALAQGYDSTFIGLATAESTNFYRSTTANSLYSIDGSTDETISGNSQGYRFPRYNNWNNQSSSANRPQNPTLNTAANSTTNAGMYSFGNYYTWAAAIANTRYYNTTGDHGATSLCPTGWRLPIGNRSTANNSFGALSVALGGPAGGARANNSSTPTGTVMSQIFRSYPNNFLYSGELSASSADYRGSGGYYWSSTAYGDGSASYYMGLGRLAVYPGTDYSNRFVGFNIRCVAGS